MGSFSIYEAIYHVNQRKPQKTSASGGVKRPYSDILKIIRDEISTNHATKLAAVLEDERGQEVLKSLITKYLHQDSLQCKEYEHSELVDKIFEDMAGFGFLTKYLYDEEVEEININAWDDIEVIKMSGYEKLHEHFISPQQAIDIVRKMCLIGGEVLDGSQPLKDSYITKGVRISAMIPPIVDEETGASASIRRQRTRSVTKQQLIEWDTATEDEIDFLLLCLNHGVSVAISGSTGSGKTTDLAMLLSNLPTDKRIYTIEDSRELNFIQRDIRGKVISRVIHTARRLSDDPKQNITNDDLLKEALRYDPNIIVPAEMRGAEALTAQEAGRTGHTICTTVHANDAKAAYTRILTLCMSSGTKLSENMMMSLIVDAFPVMLFKSQYADRTRKYREIVEATGASGDEVNCTDIYRFQISDNNPNHIKGKHVQTGYISDKLANRLYENSAPVEKIKKYARKGWEPPTYDVGKEDVECTG